MADRPLTRPLGPTALSPRPVELPGVVEQLRTENATSRSFGLADVGRVVSQDWIHSNLERALHESGFPDDPSWSLPPPTSTEGKELWAGIPTEETERFLLARSREHFQYLKDELFRQRDIEAQLAATGGAGIAARFLLNVADPVGLAASISAGPVGWISRGSRLQAFARAGTVAAGVNAALEGAALSGSMVRDSTDVALGALFGFGLGGMSGILIRGAERARAGRILSDMERQIVADDLIDAARSNGQTITRDEALAAVDQIRGRGAVAVDEAETVSAARAADAVRTERAAEPIPPATADAPVAPIGRAEGDAPVAPLADAPRAPAGAAEVVEGLSPDARARSERQARLEADPRYAAAVEAERAAFYSADPAALEAARREREEVQAAIEAAPPPAQKPAKRRSSPSVDKLRAARDKAAANLVDAEAARDALLQRAAAGFDVNEGDIAAAEAAVTRASAKLDRAVDKLDDAESKARVLYGRDDSVGAMRASLTEPIRNDEDFLSDMARRTGMTTNQLKEFVGIGSFKIRYDYASVLRGIDDPELRGTLGLLVGDPVGPKRGTNLIGATEEASRLSKIYRSRVALATDDAYEGWLSEQGVNTWRNRYSPSKRDEFAQLVGRKLSGLPVPANKHVEAAAAVQRRVLDELGDELVMRGILDQKLPDYFPRQYNFDVVEDWNLRFRTDAVVELFAQGIRQGAWGQALMREYDRDFAETLIQKVARGYHKRIREVGRQIDVEMMFGVSGGDMDYLRGLLQDGGMGAGEIEKVIQGLQEKMRREGRDDSGKPSFAKHRLTLDESATIMAVDRNGPTGVPEPISLWQLMEKNADIAVMNYIDRAVGRIAIQKITGIERDSDFTRLLNAAKSRIKDEDKRKQYVKYAQDAYDYLVGRPLEADPDGRMARVARAFRNFNMARVGSTFGLAQIADLGNVVAIGGMKALLVGMRDFRLLTQRAADGRLTNELARELSEFAGLGLDHYSTTLWSSEYGDVFNSRLGKADFALRGASRFVAVASGMTKINEWSQVLVGRMMVNRIYRGELNDARLEYLGLTREEADSMIAQLRRTATLDENGNVASLNLHEWGNGLLRDQFTRTLRKAATRAIQENDFGATFPFMHSTLGKLVLQFRNFVLVAWTKQTLHNVHMAGRRDPEAWWNMMWSLFFGGISYVAYTAATAPADEWEERMAPEKLATAAFARSGMSSLIPMIVDTPLTFAGYDPLFAYRSSGLPSNAIAGIPTVDVINRTQRLVSGVVQSATDEERYWSQKDWDNARRLLPFQNFWGVPQLSHATAEAFGLPEEPR